MQKKKLQKKLEETHFQLENAHYSHVSHAITQHCLRCAIALNQNMLASKGMQHNRAGALCEDAESIANGEQTRGASFNKTRRNTAPVALKGDRGTRDAASTVGMVSGKTELGQRQPIGIVAEQPSLQHQSQPEATGSVEEVAGQTRTTKVSKDGRSRQIETRYRRGTLGNSKAIVSTTAVDEITADVIGPDSVKIIGNVNMDKNNKPAVPTAPLQHCSSSVSSDPDLCRVQTIVSPSLPCSSSNRATATEGVTNIQAASGRPAEGGASFLPILPRSTAEKAAMANLDRQPSGPQLRESSPVSSLSVLQSDSKFSPAAANTISSPHWQSNWSTQDTPLDKTTVAMLRLLGSGKRGPARLSADGSAAPAPFIASASREQQQLLVPSSKLSKLVPLSTRVSASPEEGSSSSTGKVRTSESPVHSTLPMQSAGESSEKAANAIAVKCGGSGFPEDSKPVDPDALGMRSVTKQILPPPASTSDAVHQASTQSGAVNGSSSGKHPKASTFAEVSSQLMFNRVTVLPTDLPAATDTAARTGRQRRRSVDSPIDTALEKASNDADLEYSGSRLEPEVEVDEKAFSLYQTSPVMVPKLINKTASVMDSRNRVQKSNAHSGMVIQDELADCNDDTEHLNQIRLVAELPIRLDSFDAASDSSADE